MGGNPTKSQTKPVFQKPSFYCVETFERSIVALIGKASLLPACVLTEVLKMLMSGLATPEAQGCGRATVC